MRQYFCIIFLSIVFTGCAKLAHLHQLLTLKSLSENRDQQEKFVKQQDENFEKLLVAYHDGRLNAYPDQKSVRQSFGKPIYVKEFEENGQRQTQWLYRYSVRPFESEKIYFYFDADGKSLHFEYVEKPPARADPKTPVPADAVPPSHTP